MTTETQKVFELAYEIEVLSSEREIKQRALELANGSDEQAALLLHYARKVGGCVFEDTANLDRAA